MVWLLGGVNFLIPEEIGRLVSLTAAVITLIVSVTFVRMRLRDSKRICIAYVVSAILLLMVAVIEIDRHSVDRFPM